MSIGVFFVVGGRVNIGVFSTLGTDGERVALVVGIIVRFAEDICEKPPPHPQQALEASCPSFAYCEKVPFSDQPVP